MRDAFRRRVRARLDATDRRVASRRIHKRRDSTAQRVVPLESWIKAGLALRRSRERRLARRRRRVSGARRGVGRADDKIPQRGAAAHALRGVEPCPLAPAARRSAFGAVASTLTFADRLPQARPHRGIVRGFRGRLVHAGRTRRRRARPQARKDTRRCDARGRALLEARIPELREARHARCGLELSFLLIRLRVAVVSSLKRCERLANEYPATGLQHARSHLRGRTRARLKEGARARARARARGLPRELTAACSIVAAIVERGSDERSSLSKNAGPRASDHRAMTIVRATCRISFIRVANCASRERERDAASRARERGTRLQRVRACFELHERASSAVAGSSPTRAVTRTITSRSRADSASGEDGSMEWM